MTATMQPPTLSTHVSLTPVHRYEPLTPVALATFNTSARAPHGDEIATTGPLTGIRYGNARAAAAKKYGLDPTLVAAVAAQETGGPGVRSGNAAAGKLIPKFPEPER